MTTTWHKRPSGPQTTEKPEGWTSDKWATPPDVVARLEDEFGAFDLDPCAEHHTAKAERYYTIDEDGLQMPWFGRVFVNPPYSKPGPWCLRARQAVDGGEASLVVMLLPAAVDTRWFHQLVLPYAQVRFIRGRIRFFGWEGTPIPAPKAPSIFAIFGGHLQHVQINDAGIAGNGRAPGDQSEDAGSTPAPRSYGPPRRRRQ